MFRGGFSKDIENDLQMRLSTHCRAGLLEDLKYIRYIYKGQGAKNDSMKD